jgi:membrane-bound lytic murein transglycosylase D
MAMSKRITIIGIASFIIFAGILFCSSSTKQCSNQDIVDTKHTDYAIKSYPIPDEIEFAGERVPLENFDVRESLDRELQINAYWQSQTILFIKKAKRFFAIIEPILKENGIPEDLKYMAVAESGLLNVVSPAGAAGLWQFLEGTATDYNLEMNDEVDERYNIEKSTRAAARFLNESYRVYGTWGLAAASYNMGRRNISKQMDRQKASNYYNLVLGEETGRYLYRLIALKLILEDPEKYGFVVHRDDCYPEIPYKMVEVDSVIRSIPDFANQLGINYKLLKELNPWLRDDKLTNPRRKKYQIKIVDTDFRNVIPDTAYYSR